MTSTDLLADYKNVYNAIFDPIVLHHQDYLDNPIDINNLNKDQIIEYLNYLDSESSESDATYSILYGYIKPISDYLDNLNLTFNNIDLEDIEDEDKTELQLREQNFKRKKNSLQLIRVFLSVIIGGLALYIIKKTLTNSYDIRKNTKFNSTTNTANTIITKTTQYNEGVYSFINNISLSLVLAYIIFIINFNFDYYIKLVNTEQKKYKDLKNREIRRINTSLSLLKELTSELLCNENLANKFQEKIGILSTNILNINNNYIILSDASLDNKLAKESKIKNINKLFNNYKDTIYKQNNKFGNIIVDNEKQIVCLLNILLYLESPEKQNESLICSLNNSEGLKGLIELQKQNVEINKKFNDLEDIDENDATMLYNKITNEIIDESNKFELMNMKLFKVILNIFKIRIHKYSLKKHDFISYIYSHFENMNLEKNNITISKFDIINNYKVIINIIYKEYDLYKKLQIVNNKIPKHQISVNKFNEIMHQSSSTNIVDTQDMLTNTIKQIEEFKNMHGKEIYNDIKKEQRFNKSLEYLAYISIIISLLQVVKIVYSKSFKENYIEDAIDVTKYLTFVLLLNSIILSYWYRRSTSTDYTEMVIKNNDNEFIKELNILNENINDVKLIKNLDSSNNDTLNDDTKKLLKQNKINVSDNSEGDIIYALDIGDAKIILEENDIKNMIYEKYYIQLSKVINIHECCSFLTRKKKIPVFPWTDFTINLIFYIIIFLIMFNVFLVNDDLNPFSLITKLTSFLKINKTDMTTLKNVIEKNKLNLSSPTQTGGEKQNIFSQNNLVNLLIIYLSLLYTYKIYESTFSFNENLFK